MIATLQTEGLKTLEQIRAFLEGSQPMGSEIPSREVDSFNAPSRVPLPESSVSAPTHASAMSAARLSPGSLTATSTTSDSLPPSATFANALTSGDPVKSPSRSNYQFVMHISISISGARSTQSPVQRFPG
jgi:hypothetical protein